LEPIYYQHYEVDVPFVLSQIMNSEPILDCGCGYGGWAIMITEKLGLKQIIGVDVWKPYLLIAHQTRCYDDTILASGAHLPFRDDVFKQTLCIEVLEHLGKKDGYKLLNEINRVSQGPIILTVPNGWVATENKVRSEVHISAWANEDLEKYGYDLIQMHEGNGLCGTKYIDLVFLNENPRHHRNLQ